MSLAGRAITITLPPLGLAAVTPDGVSVFGGGSSEYPARETVRLEAPHARVDTVPDGFVAVEPRADARALSPARDGHLRRGARTSRSGSRCRRACTTSSRSTGPAPRGRFAIAVREEPVTGLSLAEARAYAAERGARLPTEDEWQLAAEAGVLERNEPLVWNWTESEHTDGRTRFAIVKGGSAFKAEGSDWYVDGGPQPPEFSLQLLLAGPLQRSDRIGFRLAVDL